MASQGHPYTIFRRALERGNFMGAEATAKELPRVGLADALELTILIARKDPHRPLRVAAVGCSATSRRTERAGWCEETTSIAARLGLTGLRRPRKKLENLVAPI